MKNLKYTWPKNIMGGNEGFKSAYEFCKKNNIDLKTTFEGAIQQMEKWTKVVEGYGNSIKDMESDLSQIRTICTK